MKFHRLYGLIALLLCFLCFSSTLLRAQQPPQAPAKAKPAQNPFEAVPQSQEPAKPKPEPAKPAQTPFERPQTAPEPAKPVAADTDVIADIEFRGSRRVPQDTLRALIITRRGDKYNEEALQRDFMALWNTTALR